MKFDQWDGLSLETKCIEYLEERGYKVKKLTQPRQYRSNQGRNPKKMESTYKVLMWSIVGLFMAVIIALVL